MQQYIDKPYESLINISHKFGISYAQLLSVHPHIKNLQFIHIAQQITVPTLSEQPDQLKEIELDAEDIMVAIDAQDWETANSKYTTLKEHFDELKPILIENSISPSLIYRLDNVITDLGETLALNDVYESKKNANLITLQTSYILDYYKEEIPTNIDRLDFLGREIILNVEKNDWITALNNLDYVNVIWKVLELELESVGEQDITELSQTIESLGQSIKNQDSVQTTRYANQLLTLVHVLEEQLKY